MGLSQSCTPKLAPGLNDLVLLLNQNPVNAEGWSSRSIVSDLDGGCCLGFLCLQTKVTLPLG